MLAAIRSAAVLGIDAYDVTVEVDAAQGLPQWTIVGLANGAVKESRERVGSALVNSGFTLPPRRITVNLAPADTRKEGSAFDLPIALGILVATGQLAPELVAGRTFVGELSLDGALREIRGALSVARHVARSAPGTVLVVPPPNLGEAARVAAVRVATPPSLRELVAQLRADDLMFEHAHDAPLVDTVSEVDFADVVGQDGAKRALEVAAAGSHNVLLRLTAGPIIATFVDHPSRARQWRPTRPHDPRRTAIYASALPNNGRAIHRAVSCSSPGTMLCDTAWTSTRS